MTFPKTYKCLSQNVFENENIKLVPIRYQDRIDIMNWRNSQLYHLRQSKPLTLNEQNEYFDNVVKKLFSEEYPNQILFSYLQDKSCLAYGGLVHINWVDKNAEISFVLDTEVEKTDFEYHWVTYLNLIEKVAFETMRLNKIYIYAFDLRPQLYVAAKKAGFFQDAILKEHCLFENKFIDVVIHSKLRNV